jgi:hypothetical protein
VSRAALRRRWYRALERSPRVYTRYLCARNPRALVVRAGRAIAIVGYPGSGNTFARDAMLWANPDLDIASHVHSWTQIAEAVRLGLPTLVLTREPIQAVSSTLVRSPQFSLPSELQAYARFQERALHFVGDTVVAEFDEVTKRFGDVVDRVNSRFGTSFLPFRHDDPASVAAVDSIMNSYDSVAFGNEVTVRTARPSPEKAALKKRVQHELASAPSLRPLLDRCQVAYRRLIQAASVADDRFGRSNM